MPHMLSITQVGRHFAEYINRVVYRGECFVLMRGKNPIAELRPLPSGKRLAELPGLLACLPHLSEVEAAQFAEDLAAARSAFSATAMHDPWQS